MGTLPLDLQEKRVVTTLSPSGSAPEVLTNEALLRALFSQHALNLNFFFLVYEGSFDSSIFLSRLEDFDPNLFSLLNATDEHEYIVSLKREHFFFFDSFGFEAAEALVALSEDKVEASEGLEEANQRFLEEGDLVEEEDHEAFNFFFKKSTLFSSLEASTPEIDETGSDESEDEAEDEAEDEDEDEDDMQAIDCKKFFKLRKREILFFMRKFYFGRKVSRSHVALFLKRLKKKSTIEVCNCASSRFIEAASLFFYFFNTAYIAFLIKHGYLYLNFGRITKRAPDLRFGSFVSCIFFSELFSIFTFFKEKLSHYARVLARKANRDLSLSVRNLLTLKRKNMNLLKFLNESSLADTRAIEMDYLSLSFFFFGGAELSLGANHGLNVFLHRLLTFR